VPLASFSMSVPMTSSLPNVSVVVAAPPQAILTPSTVPPTTVQHTEVGYSSGSGVMK